MMKPLRLVLIAVVTGTALHASALTYYSRGSGNWNDPTRWSQVTYGGAASATYPGQTGPGDVVLISGHTITLNVTPPNSLAGITLNQLGTAATTKLDLNSASTLTCTGFTMLDNNVNQHVELEVGSTAVLQVNGALNVTRATTNNRDKRLRVYVRSSGRINTTGNFTYTYNRSNNENEYEILLDNSGRIDVGGNLTCTVGNSSGGNDQFTFQMNSTSQMNVTGTSVFMVQSTGDGDDMNIDLNGGTFTSGGLTTWNVATTATSTSRMNVQIDGATWNANNGLTMTQQRGDTYSLQLNSNSTAAAAALNVTNNATLSHTDGDDQTIDLNNNSTITITGNLTCSFSENSNVAQFFDIDGGTFTVNGNMTCTVSGTGTDHDPLFEIDGGGQMSIGNDLTINMNSGDDLEILLNSNNGTSASLNVGRDLVIDRDNDADDAYIELNESAGLAIGRDLIVRHSPDNDDEFWITLNDAPSITVGRNIDLTMDSGNDNGDDLGIDQNGGSIMAEGYFSMTRSAGDDLYWDQDGAGTATFGGNWTITSTAGDEVDVTLDGTSQLSVSGDMMFDLDAAGVARLQFNENNGSGTALSVGGDLVIDHEGAADMFELLMNNGSTLNIGDDLNWDQSNAGGDYARWRMDNDINSATIGGDLAINLLTGTHSGDDIDYDQRGGTVTIGGNATFLHSAGDDFYCHVHNTSVFDVGGDLNFDHTGGDDFKFDQSSNNSWVYVDGDVNMTDANGGSTPTEFEQDNSSNSKILGDFTITANAGGQCLIDMNNTSYMEIGGSFIRAAAPNRFGSLTSDNGATIEYDGVNNVQVLSEDAGDGGDGWDYENVVIDNTYGTYPQLSTVGTTSINQALTLTNGVVYTEPTSLLVIPNNCTSTSGNAGSFVDGPMKKIGATSFTFPVGDDQVWARLRMESLANAAATTEFVCEYLQQPSPNNSSAYYSPTIDHVSYVEYWDLARAYDVAPAASCQVRLYWENSTSSGIVPANIADLRVAHFSSTTSRWENQGGTATGGSSGNVVSTTALVNFSPISFGSAADQNPLPVELLSFDARADGAVVDITWATATELNSDRFEVERSTDGITFELIATVTAAGNSQEELQYATVDPSPVDGMNLYRLKQVDIDGSYTLSDIVAVNMHASPLAGTVVYPNPGDGDLNVLLPFSDGGAFTFDVIDATGRLVMSEAFAAHGGNIVTLRTASLPDGAYSVVLRTADGGITTSQWLKAGGR